MMYSTQRLVELWPQVVLDRLELIAATLEQHAPAVVNTFLRRCHFIGQIAHESGGFKRLSENLNYSAARIREVFPKLEHRAESLAYRPEELANAAYCDRMGNGNEASGDGWRYRGRGLIQLTGRSNYELASVSLGLDLIGDPGQVALPVGAVRTALDFWHRHNCNSRADADDVLGVTRIINGGTHGLEQRQKLVDKAKTIFVDEEPLIS